MSQQTTTTPTSTPAREADYNYADFAEFIAAGGMRGFGEFPNRLHAGTKAPSYPLTRLDDGATVELGELWRRGPVVLEFGSFT